MEPLIDPRNDRKVKNCQPPPHRPLSEEILFPKGRQGKQTDHYPTDSNFFFRGT